MKKAVKKGSKKPEKHIQEKDDVIYIIEEYQDPEDDEPVNDSHKKKKSVQKAVSITQEADEEEEEEEVKPKKRKKKKKHIFLKLIIFLAILIFGVHFALTLYFGGMNVKELNKLSVSSNPKDSRTVTNILFIGTDTRDISVEAGRSDCIILLSVNRVTRKIVLTSFLRDSYVDIPGRGMNRINAAYQFGGPELLIQTIEQNFKITVDNYVMVDFFSFIDVIDAVGGVTVDVTDGELNYVNGYLNEINRLLGAPEGDGYLYNTGMVKLTGKQALAYSRIRYIGTDFARTDRQREVLMALIDTAKHQNYISLLKNMKDIFPKITTSLTASRLGWYGMEMPLWLMFDVEQQRVPADHTWSDYIAGPGMEVLQMDFEKNIAILYDSIY